MMIDNNELWTPDGEFFERTSDRRRSQSVLLILNGKAFSVKVSAEERIGGLSRTYGE